jgi:hypothetical protein
MRLRHQNSAVVVELGTVLSSQTSYILAWIIHTKTDYAELPLLSFL